MPRFNIRIYGLWLKKESGILVSEEMVHGEQVIKFPGGGLEYGEGTIDGLKREWKEELNVEIDVERHFYTTDFYQPSAWDDSQVLSIYYRIKPLEPPVIPYNNGTEHFYFLPLNRRLKELLSLPIDKAVAQKLVAGGSRIG
jgi:ADP-ribose pyrophosphatase YjhB (NUDIX family)